MIELKNLDLRMVGDQDGGYTVEAIGPEGERTSASSNWTAVAGLEADLEAIRAGDAQRATLERVGSALFQALFPMSVMRVYIAVQARLAEDEGLRLRLHLPPELERLPWELLYYPPDYLALDPRSPVVRFLDLPDTPRPLATEPPLRLLHLIAGPVDAPSLDAEAEERLLRAALSELADRVEVVPARPGTPAALRDGLRLGCQILHFSGHGGIAAGEGYLLFEDDEGHGVALNGDTLAQLLRGTDVRLAVLNACESALAVEGDAFGSVAAALVRARLPAVIAHQYPMPDRSATIFSADFYRALAAGMPVDAAVGEGRKAVMVELEPAWRDRVDWATPVLFMRAPDGRILALEGEEGPAKAGPPVGPTIQIGSITGSTITFDQRTFAGMEDAFPVYEEEVVPPGDPLPQLLDELAQIVGEHAPEGKVDQALDHVAALRQAAEQAQPDLGALEAVWQWFEAEVPALSGAVLSAILAFEPRFEEAGAEALRAFRRRFGALP
jgi:hypothetical protein